MHRLWGRWWPPNARRAVVAERVAPAPPPVLVGRPTLLLASRSRAVHRAALRELDAVGFAVVVTDDAVRARRLLDEAPPVLVVTDLTFADATGRPLVALIRERPREAAIPVVVICASRQEVERARLEGAVDVVRPPHDWRLVAARAARVVAADTVAAELRIARADLERRTRSRSRIRDEADLDAADILTGLPGRDRFVAAVGRALGGGVSEARQAVVALFTIDRRGVSSHASCRARVNAALQQCAQQLTAGLRSEELLRDVSGPSLSMAARLDDHLFATLVTGLPTREEAMKVVRVLYDRVAGGPVARGADFVPSVSAGAAIAPGDGRTPDALLDSAGLALEQARAVGSVRFHDQASHARHVHAGLINRALSQALAHDELRLHYQPLYDARTRQISAAEALLRWTSPELGAVPPSTFVPLAEESGLMVPIGTWVLSTACRQLREWVDAGLPPIRIAINLSLCQLLRSDLVRSVREALVAHRIEPSWLELEISERGVLRSDPEILQQLHEIKRLGVRLALDDFGTGNSAIAYLKQFPIDVLKIDQSFIWGLGRSAEDAAIIGATIAMARQLGLDVVAEGVEEDGQVAFLERHGCGQYQGFLFSPPVPPAEFAALLGRHSPASEGAA